MPYIADPNDPSKPLDSEGIGNSGAELRAIKQQIIDNKTVTDNTIAQLDSDTSAALTAETNSRLSADTNLQNQVTSIVDTQPDNINSAITAAISDLKSQIFHIGAYFVTRSNLAPEVILDMPGTTWVRLPKGHGIVSKEEGDLEYGSAGNIVGALEVTLTEENMPPHAHPATSTVVDDVQMREAGTALTADRFSEGGDAESAYSSQPTAINLSSKISVTTQVNNNTSANSPVDIRNSAVVENIWRRTA